MHDAKIWKLTEDSVLVCSRSSDPASRSVYLRLMVIVSRRLNVPTVDVKGTLKATVGTETLTIGNHPRQAVIAEKHGEYKR